MKILFCGLKYEYGRPDLGLATIEYQNFYQTLARMPGVEVEFFGMDEKIMESGRDVMNPLLVKAVEETKPDLLFTFLFTEELKKETIDHITRKTSTKTFNWFADDHWRFPVFSKYWAPLFTAVSTTDSHAVAKYRAIGVKNVIKTQWAANTAMFKPAENQALGLDITFLGKNYGRRGKIIGRLQSRGLPAQGLGKGWEGGVVDFEKMLEVFTNSKINLNFTESPYTTPEGRIKQLVKFFVKKEGGKYRPNFRSPISSLKSFLGTQRRQIKARTFEVPACRGFLMTEPADNLQDYYVPDKEVVIFKNFGELEEKSKYYLAHKDERKQIAEAGYQRTITEHTYEQRFREIFKAMGLI